MLRLQRRIERLEHALGVSDRIPPFEHRINFVDSDGTLSSTLLISDSRQEWIHREASEGNGKDGE